MFGLLYFQADGKQDDAAGEHLIKSDPSGKSRRLTI